MVQQEFSIYFKLVPGETAELAVVARASLEVDRLFREIAFTIDPSVDVQLNILEGQIGSLKLNTLLKGASDKKTLITIASTIAFTILADVRGYSVGKVLDSILSGPATTATLSDEDIEKIAQRVVEVSAAPQVREPVANFYREIAADETIVAVGASPAHEGPLPNLVHRSDFARRAVIEGEVLEAQGERSETRTVELVLISPVLVEKERTWDFASENQTFGARMKDISFLRRLLSGREQVQMVSGVVLTARLQIKSTRTANVWRITERNVLEVLSVRSPGSQLSLPRPGESED